MKGCLTTVLILFFIGLAFTNFFAFIGILIALWAIYEWQINRELEAKSKVPLIILIIGVFVSGVAFATDEDDSQTSQEKTKTESVQEKISNEESEDLEEKISDEETESEDPKETNDKNDEEPQINKDSNSDDSNSNEVTSEPVENQTVETDSNQQANHELVAATVTRVVDGDTIEINLNGTTEDVRLLLVDTPETVHPNEPVQPFGPEASAFAKEKLSGKQVQIEYDGPKRDKYDRMLAYIWVDGKIFNQMLLEEGLARLAYVYDPPYTHYDAFVKAQTKAVNAKKGIWSIDGYVTEEGFNSQKTEPKKSQSSSSSSNQKSSSSSSSNNNTSSNSSTSNSSNSRGTEYFKNCTELTKKYPNGVPKDHPAYQPKMDRDKDGYACER